MQVLKGQDDQEMANGIGLLSNQEVKKVILKWGMWWRWLMHSPLVWQASPEGLKVTTIVPNPLRISPQTHASCRWRRVRMHKIITCPCINTSYVLWLDWLCAYCYHSSMSWNFCLFVICFECFYVLINLYLFLCQKSKNT